MNLPPPIPGSDRDRSTARGGPTIGAARSATPIDTDAVRRALHSDGVTGLQGAFSREWTEQLRTDIWKAFVAARRREGAAVGRGPQRFYVEVHPEQLRGTVDIMTHPWFTAVCATMLGPDYQIVEIGFDVPLPGAVDQPWHRDFAAPVETYRDHRLTSLAFNLTAVDTTAEMGPFEIAPGTQWEEGATFDHRMFPAKGEWPRFQALAVRKLPQMGDISVRSALTIHRGTANHSARPRPVLVVGVDAPGAGHAELHDMAVTRSYHDSLPEQLRSHLACAVVDELHPIIAKHTIEGLVMGVS